MRRAHKTYALFYVGVGKYALAVWLPASVLILLCFSQVPCRHAHLKMGVTVPSSPGLGVGLTLAWDPWLIRSHTENQESQVWGRWERGQELSGVVRLPDWWGTWASMGAFTGPGSYLPLWQLEPQVQA